MEKVCTVLGKDATLQSRRSRDEVVAKVISFEHAVEKLGISQRCFAEAVGVPRSTLQGWIDTKASIDASPALVEFLESPEGVVFLHRLVLAAQIVIALMGAGGIRLVCTFLTLSGLAPFVASSYGAQQEAIATLEEHLGRFGAQETQRLGRHMRPKKITIIEDETFHPQICLVAMEGASGFIILEKYAEGRDSATWTEELKSALGDLPVEIVQVTSDEATGLAKHTGDLGAHHSPDLFHPQQDLVRGTSASMATRVKKARAAVTEAEKTAKMVEEVYEVDERFEDKSSANLPAPLRKRVEEAREAEAQARHHLEKAESQQEEMSGAIRDISHSYHPFDLASGKARSAELVKTELERHFDDIEELGVLAGLSERCFERIAKARRVLPSMVATITLFHGAIARWIGDLGLSEELERFVLARWIPGRYLELVAERAQRSEQRSRLGQAVATVMPSATEMEFWLRSLSEEDRLLLASVVEQCAQLFQRSSSGVEGRNGHLSFFHHGHHRLTSRKLGALTVIHNFLKVRLDETTAAERFFGQPPQDVFEWLVEVMPLPARPRKPRRKAAA